MKIALFGFAMGFLAMGLTSSSALAATSTASFSVTATVVSDCQASVPATAFGAYQSSRAAVSVTCTNPTTYNVSLSSGRTTDAITRNSTQTMLKTVGFVSESLGHGLRPELAHTTNWSRTTGRDSVASTGGGYSQQHPVNGLAAKAKNFAPSPYDDLIFVTVTY